MVAKGHDFEGVSLGVVLDADATLRFPDFRGRGADVRAARAARRRTGRGRGDGRVLVQTLAGDARAIVYAARHEQCRLLTGELERRRALGYPPYGELIRIVCSAQRRGSAMRRSLRVASALGDRHRPASSVRRRYSVCAVEIVRSS